MWGWCLAYCTGVVLNTVGESAMPDSKENKQADAGSRRFRRHFLCGALLCNFLSTGHEGLSTHTCPTGMVSRTFYAQHSVTKNLLYSSIIEMQIQSSYCVCVVFSSHSFWTSSSLDVPAGVTQEEGHTGGRSHRISHPPSFCGACLNFLARRIQPFLSLVDREVEFCVLTI